MATMVARGSSQVSSSVPIQERGSRNKRKFRADPPLTDQNKLFPSQDDCLDYEFPMDKPPNGCNVVDHASICELCSGIAFGCSKEEVGLEEFQDADWNDVTETQLEDLVLSNLDTIFKSAIKKITAFGYTEEVATKAVLRAGICYGYKDIVSNIVENTLPFLSNGQELDATSSEHFFENLQQLEKYILAEMVCVVREVRPFFSTGDAMWCLLLCDMNVSHACSMDGSSLGSLGAEEVAGNSSIANSNPESNSSVPTNLPEFNVPRPSKPNLLLPHPQAALQPEMPVVAGIPNLPSVKFSASANVHATTSQGKENLLSSSNSVVGESSSSAALSLSHLLEEKPVGSKKAHGISSKRESMLRQKPIYSDKSYRTHGSKGALRTGKLSGLGSLILDKKFRSISDSTGVNLKSASLKLSKAISVDASQADGNPTKSFNAVPSASSLFISKVANSPSPLPVANTELSLSIPSITSSCSSSSSDGGGSGNRKSDYGNETAHFSGFAGLPSDNVGRKFVQKDQKDEMVLKLVPRVQELQAQLQEWTDWAQQKVMQAARRLGKDKAELQTLRQEKEEVARLKKEKQTLEENTLKKLSEMENALSKANSQVERANAAECRLKVENDELKEEMEIAKLRDAESAASCQEVSRREMKTLKKFQSWERQKIMFQEELVNERRKVSQLQQQLDQATEYQEKLEARWRQGEKLKEEALLRVDFERKEREQIEASAKSKEDAIRSKAESDLQRYRDDIRKLESEIARLRLTNDSSKIAALQWGADGSCASPLANRKNSQAPKNSTTQYISEILDLQESDFEEVQRERECVMCLTEERSVVFLPCGHQVVCRNCNELHEKQGMKDCPSCRIPIQQRICVRTAGS